MKKTFIGLVLIVCMFSCKNSNDYKAFLHSPTLFSATVHELNTVVMGNNFPPMVASRNYAYASIAAYEVVAAAYPQQYQSLGNQLNGLKTVHAPKLTEDVDVELATILAYIKVGEAVTFPEGSMKEYKDSIIRVAKEKGLSTKTEKASIFFADSIGMEIIRWSKKDNYLQTRSAEKYAVQDIPGRWVPTPPLYATAAEPHWKEIRTMVVDSAGIFAPAPPPTFNITDINSKYFQEVLLIKNAK